MLKLQTNNYFIFDIAVALNFVFDKTKKQMKHIIKGLSVNSCTYILTDSRENLHAFQKYQKRMCILESVFIQYKKKIGRNKPAC